MNQIQYTLLTATFLFFAPVVSAEEKSPSGVWIDHESFSELRLPSAGDIPHLLLDFEYLENETPKAFVTDFNGDGIDDYLVQSSNRLCGNGGCPYALVDGKTKKRIGEFFGSPMLILDQKINGHPVIQCYAHLNAESGGFATWVFEGKKYQIVSSVYLEGKSVQELFKKMNALRKASAVK